jgi:hypothetical protein
MSHAPKDKKTKQLLNMYASESSLDAFSGGKGFELWVAAFLHWTKDKLLAFTTNGGKELHYSLRVASVAASKQLLCAVRVRCDNVHSYAI